MHASRAGGTTGPFVLALMRRSRKGKGKAACPKLMRSDNKDYRLGHSWPSKSEALRPHNVRAFKDWVDNLRRRPQARRVEADENDVEKKGGSDKAQPGRLTAERFPSPASVRREPG